MISFSNKRYSPNLKTLRSGNIPIKEVTSVRHLDIHLDIQLRYATQINSIKSGHPMKLIYPFVTASSRLSEEMKTLYVAYVRSMIRYTFVLYFIFVSLFYYIFILSYLLLYLFEVTYGISFVYFSSAPRLLEDFTDCTYVYYVVSPFSKYCSVYFNYSSIDHCHLLLLILSLAVGLFFSVPFRAFCCIKLILY